MDQADILYVVKYYKDSRGKSPFWKWLERLKDRKARATIKVRIDRVERGNLGDCRSLGNGIFEIKIRFGPGYRVYFGFLEQAIVVMLMGGSKKTQSQDIERAKNLWVECKNAYENQNEKTFG